MVFVLPVLNRVYNFAKSVLNSAHDMCKSVLIDFFSDTAAILN